MKPVLVRQTGVIGIWVGDRANVRPVPSDGPKIIQAPRAPSSRTGQERPTATTPRIATHPSRRGPVGGMRGGSPPHPESTRGSRWRQDHGQRPNHPTPRQAAEAQGPHTQSPPAPKGRASPPPGGAEPPPDRPPGRHGQIPTTATPTAPQKPTARPPAQGGTGGGPRRATSQGGPQRRKRGRLPSRSRPPRGVPQHPGASAPADDPRQERTHDHHPPPQPTGHHGITNGSNLQTPAPPTAQEQSRRGGDHPNLHGPPRPRPSTTTPVGQTHSHRGTVDPGPPTHTDHQTSPAPQMHGPQHHRPTREDTVTNPP
ncbi:proline-rich protein 2-like [Solea solea]|uniref:proline-rich protein 2-like n=1 Tax=Solea solea TaxID=90069 RepID=UPI00272AC374|nr:proline-rich protein 2-like [Solea solea]